MIGWIRNQIEGGVAGRKIPSSRAVATASGGTSTAPAPALVGTASVGVPNAVTGVVIGSLNVAATDGRSLTYQVTGLPLKGSVNVSSDGTYSYTPALIARLWAGVTATGDFDSFTVTARDGVNSSSISVSCPILPSVLSVKADVGVGSGPNGVAVAGGYAYVANQAGGSVSVIDIGTNRVISTIPVVANPAALAVDAESGRVYVAGSGAVSVIDSATNTVVATTSIGTGQSYGIVLSPNGTRSYVTQSGTNRVVVISTLNDKVLTTVRVGSTPGGIAVSPDGSRLYVVNFGSKNVSVINTGTNRVVSSIRVGTNPSSVAVTPDGKRLYVANSGANTVSVINTATRKVAATVTVGVQPWSVVISPDGKTAYIATADDKVTLMDTVSNTIITSVATDPAAEASTHMLAISTDGTTLYVTDQADGTLRTLTFVRGNTAPAAAGAPTASTPDPTTGAVRGSLNISDADGDQLTYAIVTSPARGTVTIDAVTGTYTYTPDSTARQQVSLGTGAADTFTIAVSDSLVTKTLKVSVPLAVAGTVAATPYLPFDMPIGPTSQKVFAHYVPWMPISYDNLPAAIDYYTTELLNILGENGIHSAYGGYLRDRPLPRDPIDSAEWRYLDVLTEVNQAKSVGIDGFTVDITSPSQQNEAINNLLRAAQATTGFSIQPQADLSSSVVAGMTAGQFAAAFAPYLSSPGAFRLADGRVVLSAFYAENKSTAWWNSTLTTLRNTYGLDVAFVPTFLDAYHYMAAFAPISYGFGNWGGRNTSTVDPAATGPGSQVDLVRTAHNLGKVWMQPVAFQDARPREGLYEESNNSQTATNAWQIAVSEGAEWVQLVTWNDYAEGSAMAPSIEHGWKMLDLQAYNIAQFKYRSTSAVVRDAVYVSHRAQLANSESSYPESLPMKVRPGTPPPVDTVEVVVFATAPATVRATIGGVTSTCAVGGGRSVCNFSLRAGDVVIALERGGQVVTLVNSPYKVTNAPYTADLEYHMAGGLR
ncbi:endo-1,3-alpha-glucanase family glycosylhydrolase [Mycolicibacterium rufum]